MKKRLYRSRKDKMLAGICGGLAEYFAVDPSLVRIECELLCIYYGKGLLFYILAAKIIQEYTT